MNLNKTTVRKLLQTVDAGLCYGIGYPTPGEMCVEAAVCYALGLPHRDDPGCVGWAVRKLVIGLNDSLWSSDAARAKGLRKLAVAQLGSDQLDQTRFAELVAVRAVQQLCPPIFAKLSEKVKTKEERKAMEAVGRACSEVGSLQEAVTALVGDFNPTRGRHVIYDLDLELAYALEVAYNIKGTFNSDNIIPAHLLGITNDRAIVLATNISRSLTLASSRDSDSVFVLNRDEALTRLADVCVEVLVEMESPGCQWLFLCETPEAQDPNRGAFGARACGEIDGYGGLHSQ